MAELRPSYTTQDARDTILEAALTVFARSGFSGTTMRDIAQEAGVSAGLIHHHFKDKETLWNVVGERITDDFSGSLALIAGEAQEVDETTIPVLVANYMDYWKTHPSALRFQLWRLLGAPESERKARSQRLNRHNVPIFARAQQAGLVRDDIPAGLAMITTGGLIQFWLHSRLEAGDAIAAGGDPMPDDEAFLQYVLSLVLVPKRPAQPQTKLRKLQTGKAKTAVATAAPAALVPRVGPAKPVSPVKQVKSARPAKKAPR